MTDEQAKDPRESRGPADPAPPTPEPESPAESSLPPEGSERPAEEDSTSPATSQSSQETEGDVDVQSKFDRPASTLGIRPSLEQSKAAQAPAGLGALPRSLAPRGETAADAPAIPGPPPAGLVPPASAPGRLPPPARVAQAAPVPPPVPAPAVPRYVPVRPPTPGPPTPGSVLEEEAPPEHVPTWAERFRRLPPALVILGLGSLGALGFLVYAMTSHTTPVAVLLSAGVVVTLAFATDAVIASVATWRAAVWDEDPGRALLLAVVAGGSAIVAAGSLGAVTVLLMVLTGF